MTPRLVSRADLSREPDPVAAWQARTFVSARGRPADGATDGRLSFLYQRDSPDYDPANQLVPGGAMGSLLLQPFCCSPSRLPRLPWLLTRTWRAWQRATRARSVGIASLGLRPQANGPAQRTIPSRGASRATPERLASPTFRGDSSTVKRSRSGATLRPQRHGWSVVGPPRGDRESEERT